MFYRHLMFALWLSTASTASAQNFENLFRDRSLAQWMSQDGESVVRGWKFDADGTLHLSEKGGHIASRGTYEDFELWFEFRIAPGGNSGVKYRATRYGDSLLGLEYQVLDDAAFPNLPRKHQTASLYDLVPPGPKTTKLAAAGEFNVGKIRVENQHIRHWINGQLVVNTHAANSTWRQLVRDSKYDRHGTFGENTTGHIMLTDHGSDVWYRNMYIKRLGNGACR